MRYATVQRTRNENFLQHDPHDGPMPMDYFVWLIRGNGRDVLVDTGFNARAAAQRRREFLRCPIRSLEMLGVDVARIEDVILTHLHYDHAGNIDLLPGARFHLQESELKYSVSRFMTYRPLRHSYCVDDIKCIVDRLYRERVVFYSGDAPMAPGIEVVHIGGHTEGLQAVRVHTRRGWVVLASDATHFYENMSGDAPFPIVHDVGAMLDGFRRLQRLAESPHHIIPGHDPLVLQRYPSHATARDVVALHMDPVA
ncbi:N-acyl homoserine lactonase family protein [soil metagenome]